MIMKQRACRGDLVFISFIIMTCRACKSDLMFIVFVIVTQATEREDVIFVKLYNNATNMTSKLLTLQ